MRARRALVPLACIFLAAPIPANSQTPEKTAAESAAAEKQKAGRAVFQKVVAALGEPDKVAKVRDVRVEATATVKTPQGDLRIGIVQTTVLPDRLCQEIQAPFGAMKSVITPKEAFLTTPQGTQDLPSLARQEQTRELARSALLLAQRPSDPKLVLAVAGQAKVAGVDLTVVDVSYGAAQVRWFVDPATGRILRTQVHSQSEEGPVERITDYSDYRTVDGLVFAFHQDTSLNGAHEQTVEVSRITINASPDPKIFERPAAADSPR